jgi:hypothetical protein
MGVCKESFGEEEKFSIFLNPDFVWLMLYLAFLNHAKNEAFIIIKWSLYTLLTLIYP